MQVEDKEFTDKKHINKCQSNAIDVILKCIYTFNTCCFLLQMCLKRCLIVLDYLKTDK